MFSWRTVVSADQVVVILGGGQGALSCAEELRKRGHTGSITIVCGEKTPPYRRPPLSKECLKDPEFDSAKLLLKKESWYEESGVRLLLETSAVALDRDAKTVSLVGADDQRSELPYDKLVIATGASARQLPIPYPERGAVATLRTIEDVERIKQTQADSQRCVILGGGYIGLEVAASLSSTGKEVIVLELAPRILQRVSSPTMSSYITHQFRKRGISIDCEVQVNQIKDSASFLELVTAGDAGLSYFANHVVYGVGIDANDQLAASAGIECDRGVLIDRACQTSADDIYAIGDVARHRDHKFEGECRLESVPNAMETGRIAAAAITGTSIPEQEVPWFWSDQFDMKIQLLGTGMTHEENASPNIDLDADSLFLKHDNRGRMSVEAVNASRQFLDTRRELNA